MKNGMGYNWAMIKDFLSNFMKKLKQIWLFWTYYVCTNEAYFKKMSFGSQLVHNLFTDASGLKIYTLFIY